MSYQNFLINLQKYKPFESIAQDRICSLFNTEILNVCCYKDYDFETTQKIKYELKTDEKSLTTGNFYIEYQGYNKLSGITTTKADYYILSNTKEYYLIDVGILRALTKNKPTRATKDGSTLGYIINKNLIIKHSIEI